MKRFEALTWASSLLEEVQLETNYAKVYLQALLNEDHTQFVLNREETLSPQLIDQFQHGIQQHIATGIPYQHLVGWAEFYGQRFIVTEDTLIPRFETEELVKWVLIDLSDKPLTIADIGTGSGIIAITLKMHASQHQLIMTDIYQPTLDIAKKNAQQHQVTITEYLGDALIPMIDKQQQVDVIISNPPYIAFEEIDTLSNTVVDFDPHQALFADNKGLAIYERIIQQAHQVLKPNGVIYFEIGHQQAEDLTKIVLNYYPHANIIVKQDLNNKDRMMKISNIRRSL